MSERNIVTMANIASQSPTGLLKAAQDAARAEYDKAKRERDAASSDMHRAEQSMRIWNEQLTELNRAISAIGALAQS